MVYTEAFSLNMDNIKLKKKNITIIIINVQIYLQNSLLYVKRLYFIKIICSNLQFFSLALCTALAVASARLAVANL